MSVFAIFGLPGGMEVVFLIGIILLLFGSSQLPKLMMNIGRSKNALQKGLKDGMKEAEEEAEEEAQAQESEEK